MRRYISDLHFFDEDVCFKMDNRGFSSIQEMNNYMIQKWNQTVAPGDEIFVLGDMFSWTGAEKNAKKINCTLQRLHGKIVLIEGNHDKTWLNKPDINKRRFRDIQKYKEIKDSGRELILCHYPIPFFGKNHSTMPNGDPKVWMLHGHLHDSQETKLLNEFKEIAQNTTFTNRPKGDVQMTINTLNCFCGFSDYEPWTLDEWINYFKTHKTEG